VALAYTANKTILPVILHHAEIPPRLDYAMSGLDVIDISNDNGENGSQRVLDALLSPEARTRGTYLSLWRGPRKYFLYPLWLAAFAMAAQNWRWHCLFVIAPAIVFAWLVGGRELFWHSYRLVLQRTLAHRSTVISTRFKGVVRGFRQWIVSEWNDPNSGKRYEFYSDPLRWAPVDFVPKCIRVIVNPCNFRVYQMDVSFLPRNVGGVWMAGDKDTPSRERSDPRRVFVCHSDSARDKERVSMLIRALEAAGYLVDTGSECQDEAVIQPIQQSWLFLIMLSEASAHLDRVQRELDLAIAYRKPIIAAVLGGPQLPAHVDYALAGVRRFDLSRDTKADINRLLDAITGETSAGTLTYKADKFASIRKLVRLAGSAIFILLCLPFFIWVAQAVFRWTWWHVGPNNRSFLSWAASIGHRIEERFGIWTDQDLRMRGAALPTEYKYCAGGRVVSQWRDPLSNQLYLFKSDSLAIDSSQLTGIRTITVYANPENLRRYYMDLPSLPRKDAGAFSRTEKPEPVGNEILLSYSRQHSNQAITLSRLLNGEGFEVFDLHERQKGPTAEQDETIKRGQTLIIIIPAPDTSDLGVMIEHLKIARDRGNRIVPVTVGALAAMPLSMQYALAGVHCIDLPDILGGVAEPLLKALGRFRVAVPEVVSGHDISGSDSL
jgi:TIR domain